MANDLILDHEMAIRKKKKNRIIALSVIGVALVLAILIIVGACVPMNLKPAVVGKPDRVVIYDKSNAYGEFSSDQGLYSDFMEKFDNIYQASYLVSLFSGRLGDYRISGQSENLTLSSVKSNVLEKGYYVEFKYSQPQTLKYADGSEYRNIFAQNEKLTFTSIYFALSEKNELENLDMYVAVKYSAAENATTYVVKVTQKANTNPIYSSIEDFKTL